MECIQSLGGIQILRPTDSKRKGREMAGFIVETTVEDCLPNDWKFRVEATQRKNEKEFFGNN